MSLNVKSVWHQCWGTSAKCAASAPLPHSSHSVSVTHHSSDKYPVILSRKMSRDMSRASKVFPFLRDRLIYKKTAITECPELCNSGLSTFDSSRWTSRLWSPLLRVLLTIAYYCLLLLTIKLTIRPTTSTTTTTKTTQALRCGASRVHTDLPRIRH